ncbi:hypothetical protein Thein_1605 [Thermodesulfatator indicus DSM 15286]|uniref:Uncharacterized protein n=1 Tax=Thermodesulfatator indicus (strain DSM 15286 / JCM 11887 / CIR29812) TaxID=667014 RepID=F8AAV4_THEID|nr:hypothetical protein [Thermodesulfatator indicus]AEH45465.1 hypothetical protein Thein_1605 [Thermodesulfatator indicus DSM 15286]
MPSKPEAFVVHSLKGRVRLKAPALKNRPKELDHIISTIDSLENVKKVSGNPQTGSILLEYEGSPQVFWNKLRELDVLDIKKAEEVAVKSQLQTVFKKADEAIKESSHYRLDLGTSVGLACVAVGLYQLLRGRTNLPSWYTAFWYSLHFFKK